MFGAEFGIGAHVAHRGEAYDKVAREKPRDETRCKKEGVAANLDRNP